MIRSDKKLLGIIPVNLLLAACLVLAAVAGFCLIANEVVLEREDIFDTATFHFLHEHVRGAGIGFLKFLTFFGSLPFLLPAYCITIIACPISHRKRMALDIAIIGATGFALLLGLKQAFHRSRPEMPLFNAVAGYSFPSGHAMSSFVFCAVLIHLVRVASWPSWLKWCVSLLLLAFSIAVGVSRIVLRVHYALRFCEYSEDLFSGNVGLERLLLQNVHRIGK